MTKLKLLQATNYYIKYLQYLVKLAIWKVKHGRHPSLPTTPLPLHQRKKFLTAIFFLVFIAPAIIYLGLKAAKPAVAAWFDESYSYRQPFSFTHNADIDAQRAITFSLDTAELITDGVMQSDCDDTRFTDINGKLLKYELTGTCNNAATTYEVIFESIINGSNVGYVYYGNSSAISASIDSSGYTALTPSGGDPSITTRTNEEQSPGPIAYWKFDEGYGATANDSTANANNGTISEATWQDESICLSGKCLQFDGTDDYVSIANDDEISGLAEITVEAWINPKTSGVWRGIIGSEGTGAYHFQIQTGNLLQFYVYGPGDDAFSTTSFSGSNLNKWFHVVGTYDGSTIKVYVNGVEEGSQGGLSGDIASSSDIRIGRASSVSRTFNGFMDDVKIYPYARTATQIKSDYASRGSVKGTSASFGNEDPFASLSQGLVGYWKMDETATPSLDSSGNGKSGTWTNSPTLSTGKFGNSLTYNDNDSYVNLASHTPSSFSTEDFTISAWVKQSSSNQLKKVIFKGNPYCDGCTSGYVIYIHSGVPRFVIDLSSETGDLYLAYNNGTTIDDGNWHLVVGQKTGDIIKLFVDGNLIDTTTLPVGSSISSIGDNLTISGSSYAYDGSIDETRIYNRALSPREVRALYNYAPGPLIHFPLDEGTGITTYDKAGGSTGTLTNSPIWINGQYGKGLQFSNPDDNYVAFTPAINLNSANENLTVSIWFKNASAGNYMTARSGGGVFIARSGNNISFRVNPGVSTSCVGTSNPSADDKWHYATLTWDGDTVSGYIDGILECTDNTGSGSLNLGTTLWHIGHRPALTGVTGKLDDFRLYNYLRTPGQIIQDMNAGHPMGGSPISSKLLHLQLNEGYGTTANDTGINDDNGDLVDGPTWTNSGKFDKALSFDGLNDRIQSFTSDPFEYTGENLTMSLWFKPNASDTDVGDIISKPWNGSGEYNYVLALTASDTISVKLYNGGTDTNDTILTSTNSLNTNEWNHLVATINGNTSLVSIYINGILDNSATHSITDWDPDTGDNNVSLLIGSKYPYNPSWAGNTAFSVQGEIDEVKIYNTALTQEEILIDMNQGSGVVMGALSTASDGSTASFSSDRSYCPPGDTTASCSPIAEWKMDYKTGTTVYDTSSNGYNGSLIDSPTWNSSAQCHTGSCLQFDNSCVDVYSTSFRDAFNGDEGTVEVWTRVKNAGVWTDGTARTIFRFRVDGDNEVLIRRHTNNNYIQYSYEASTTLIQIGNSSVSDTNWMHLTITWSASNDELKAYHNSQLIGTSTGLGTWVGDLSYLYTTLAGNRSDTCDNEWLGWLDNVTVYDYARTQAQIAWDYNRGKPVGHWKLDECQGITTYDSSGNENHGTITAGDTSGSNDSVGTCNSGAGDEMWNNGTTGKRNYSLDFDGTNDYATIDFSNSDGDYPKFSVATWIYWGTKEGAQTILNEQNADTLWLNVDTSGNDKLNVYLGDTTNTGYHNSNNTITRGQWNHIMITYDDDVDELKLYINEVLDSTITTSGIPNFDTSITMGIREDKVANTYFDGQIDDVKIFNYALTPLQIKTEYNAGALFFGPTTGNP